MIKLTVEKEDEKKEQYLTEVKDEVINRIEILLISLNHLNKKSIDLDEGAGIISFKVTTRKTIKIIEEENFIIKEADYNKSKYAKTVQSYLASSTNLAQVNIVGIIDLLNSLIEKDAKNLEALLTCPAGGLSTINKLLLSAVNPLSGKELEIIKLAFNYNSYKNVSGPIKKFFKKNFIKYCPYCNLEKVEILTIKGKNATGHQLDHFFSQTDHPLLSYSLFNLVPSGSNCNGTINKGEIPFTDEFHMNPHSSGFGDNMRFIPIKPGIAVIGINLEFNCVPGSKEMKQLIGDLTKIDELHDKGNINVFKLRTKYSDEEHVEWANILLGRIHNAHKTQRSISKFIDMMKNVDREAIHLEWYKNQISTPFYSENFGSRKDSKFNRDIHDYYFETNKSIINKFFKCISPFLKKY